LRKGTLKKRSHYSFLNGRKKRGGTPERKRRKESAPFVFQTKHTKKNDSRCEEGKRGGGQRRGLRLSWQDARRGGGGEGEKRYRGGKRKKRNALFEIAWRGGLPGSEGEKWQEEKGKKRRGGETLGKPGERPAPPRESEMSFKGRGGKAEGRHVAGGPENWSKREKKTTKRYKREVPSYCLRWKKKKEKTAETPDHEKDKKGGGGVSIGL